MSIWGQVVIYGLYGLAVVCTIVVIIAFWRKWYAPLQDNLDSLPGRLIILGFTWLTGVLAYIQARGWLMYLTEVEPNNFPRALVIFTGFALLIAWPALITGGAMLLAMIYLVVHIILEKLWEPLQVARSLLGFTSTQKPALFSLSPNRAMVYFFGILGLFAFTGFLLIALYRPPFSRWFHHAGSMVLAFTEFAYDKTCPVSSKTLWVALLKDRKDLETTKVMIADVQSWTHIQFSIGQCK